MKKYLILPFIILQSLVSQYNFKSQYLQNSEMLFGYVDSCAKFWMKAYEPTYGGFYVNINQTGNLSGSSIKNTLNQSRDAYGFIRAFQLTGDTSYLTYARYGLNFMYKYGWDKTYGGWNNDINGIGTATNATGNKSAYHQHYAMLGITAAYEALRDTNDLNWLLKSYSYNESHFWDSSAANFGYYDYVKYDGTTPTDKSFNATVDAVTTHLLHLYLMTGEQQYKVRLLELADNMINHLAASAPLQQIGFAEKYTTSWEIRSSNSNNEKRTIMGHVLKTGWCLARIYELEKDPILLSTAEQLVQIVLDKGYDHQNGGPYKDYDRTTGAMMMYGQDTAKAWWQMEQAITSGFMLYHVTGKEKYLKMADETLDFFMKYFVDHVYGDVFADAYKNGGRIVAWGTTKGSDGKAAYHSIETGYYSYLYGKLLVKKEPAVLYYRFGAENRDRTFAMRPIGVPNGSLSISGIKKNDSVYSNFSSDQLTITLPANISGVFAVTYQPQIVNSIASSKNNSPNSFTLLQNYPNPFNPTTAISYQIPLNPPLQRGNDGGAGRGILVSLKVYDAIGREVATLVNEVKEPGNYTVQFNGSGLSSGMYFYRIQTGNFVETKKMLLMK
ncbi:MAG: AGE family epimerase/isomerase [Bacteroidota bacterium]|nr:AGE family epimerase/isomerase [Bacteroidota bacterium]